jgi:hypothetical protein
MINAGNSMYAHLVASALGELEKSQGSPVAATALSELRRCRRQLRMSLASRTGRDWAPAAVADQVAYDVALTRLARSLGVECDPTTFDRPEQQRLRLERAIAVAGIQLNATEPTGPPPQ